MHIATLSRHLTLLTEFNPHMVILIETKAREVKASPFFNER